MKLFVKTVVKDDKLTWPSRHYIDKYRKFDIKCTILDEDLGFTKDKYELCLEGARDSIVSFLSYLRMKGFKIK